MMAKADTTSLELTREERAAAVDSIQRYFEAELEQKIGNLQAGALLGFFLQEIAPSVYNRAVADVQENLQTRIAEIDLEVHADEFQYWRKTLRR